MTLQMRKPSWFVAGLVFVVVATAGVELCVAQPRTDTPRTVPESKEATFELLSDDALVNIHNIAYTSDEDGKFDIFFACSSVRNPAPLRLVEENDIKRAKAYFGDEKRYGKHFIALNQYRVSVRNIAFIETKKDSLTVNFNIRQGDWFAYLTFSGEDAEAFRQKLKGF